MERTVCKDNRRDGDRQSGGGGEGKRGRGGRRNGMERDARQKAHTKMIHYGILWAENIFKLPPMPWDTNATASARVCVCLSVCEWM